MRVFNVHTIMNTMMAKANNASKTNQAMLKLPFYLCVRDSRIFLHSKQLMKNSLTMPNRWHAVPLALAVAVTLNACAPLSPPPAAPDTKPKPGASTPTVKPATTGVKKADGTTAEADNRPAEPAYKRVELSEVPGWDNYDFSSGYLNFKNQCTALLKRKNAAAELKSTCDAVVKTKKPEKLTAKQWFESKFDAWQIVQADGQKQGLLTGYFEPMVKGSRQKRDKFLHPLFPTPADLLTIDLAETYPTLKGMRLRGRLEGNKVVAYPSRAEWEKHGEKKVDPLVWLDDALDAFLLQVQGSGRVELDSGQTVRLGYADQNGHPYVAIGKVLVNRGALTVEEATIPGIRKWAEKNPKELAGLLNENPSVVFFKESVLSNPNEGPVGSLGVPLVPEMSIAVDPSVIPLGSPVILASEHPVSKSSYEKLVFAQDTGGAIRGRVRADLFWGWGKIPGELAGVTRQPLGLWLLWPKGSVPVEGR